MSDKPYEIYRTEDGFLAVRTIRPEEPKEIVSEIPSEESKPKKRKSKRSK